MLYGQLKIAMDPTLMGAGIGALGGAGIGAMIPSKDNNGETHRLRNAFMGALGGGVLGAGAGYGYDKMNPEQPREYKGDPVVTNLAENKSWRGINTQAQPDSRAWLDNVKNVNDESQREHVLNKIHDPTSIVKDMRTLGNTVNEAAGPYHMYPNASPLAPYEYYQNPKLQAEDWAESVLNRADPTRFNTGQHAYGHQHMIWDGMQNKENVLNHIKKLLNK